MCSVDRRSTCAQASASLEVSKTWQTALQTQGSEGLATAGLRVSRDHKQNYWAHWTGLKALKPWTRNPDPDGC